MYGEKIAMVNEDGQVFGFWLVRCKKEFQDSHLLDWEETGDDERGPWGYPKHSDVWDQERGGWEFDTPEHAEEAVLILLEERTEYADAMLAFADKYEVRP